MAIPRKSCRKLTAVARHAEDVVHAQVNLENTREERVRNCRWPRTDLTRACDCDCQIQFGLDGVAPRGPVHPCARARYPRFQPPPTGRVPRELLGQRLPLRAGLQDPENAVETLAIAAPWPTATVLAARQRWQVRFDQSPLFIRDPEHGQNQAREGAAKPAAVPWNARDSVLGQHG